MLEMISHLRPVPVGTDGAAIPEAHLDSLGEPRLHRCAVGPGGPVTELIIILLLPLESVIDLRIADRRQQRRHYSQPKGSDCLRTNEAVSYIKGTNSDGGC